MEIGVKNTCKTREIPVVRARARGLQSTIGHIARHSTESEKAIEAYLVKRVKAIGGICLKYSSASVTGYPDRIVMLPGGITFWVELKSKGQHPEKRQEIRIDELRAIGQRVEVVDSKEGVDSVLEGEPCHEI